MVTNQPDVTRGLQQRKMIEAINEILRRRLRLDDIHVCYHDDQDHCSCRKPAPGLLLAACDKWDLDLASSVMVGDRWKDIEAGRQAGCRTILIDNPYAQAERCHPDHRASSLPEATNWILSQSKSKL